MCFYLTAFWFSEFVAVMDMKQMTRGVRRFDALRALDNAILATYYYNAPHDMIGRLLAERSAEASQVGAFFLAEPCESAKLNNFQEIG